MGVARTEQPRSEQAGLAGIERGLQIVIRLLGAQLTQGMTRKDEILTLSGAGLTPKEVSDMLGISSNQVSVALYDAKQSAKNKSISKKVHNPKEAPGSG